MAYYIKQNLPLAKRTAKGNLSEVDLFRQMMAVFKICYGATVILSETHRNYVGFSTIDLATKKNIPNQTREISDLHIITYSPTLRIARETYLQAKATSKGLNNGTFQFDGDWYQYDLLSRRPVVQRPLKKPPYWRAICCPHFLNKSILPSMGSYGIFYETGHNNINFAYQPANQLVSSGTGITCRSFEINANVPKYANMLGIPDLQHTYDVDEFEYAVTHNLIGSPITWRNLWPCYPFLDDYPWALNLYAYNNTEAQIEEVVDGLRDFYYYLRENAIRADRNNREDRIDLEQYHQLWRFTEYENLPNNVERRVLLESNNRNDLCRGSESLILLNTDKINIGEYKQ
jgi:hypothetical protein